MSLSGVIDRTTVEGLLTGVSMTQRQQHHYSLSKTGDRRLPKAGIGSTLHSPWAAPWAESFQVAHSFWDFSRPLSWFLPPLGNSVCLILSLHSSYCLWMLGEGRAKETLILSETFRSYSVVYPEFKAFPCQVECFPPLRLSDCLTSVLMLCVNKLPRGRSFCFIFPWTTCSLMWFPPR